MILANTELSGMEMTLVNAMSREFLGELENLISVWQAMEPDVEVYQELAEMIQEVQTLLAMNPPYDLHYQQHGSAA